MEKITKLTLFVVLLGLIVFGQALGAASAQTEPSQPVIILATPDSSSAVTRPEQTAPLPTPIAPDAAQLPAPISSADSIRDARLKPIENGFLVTWKTAQPSTGWVIFGNTPNSLDRRIPAADASISQNTDHSILLPSPPPDVPIYFAFVIDGVRQDAGGWPFKVYAGGLGGPLATTPTTSSQEALPPDTSLPIEVPNPGLGGPAIGPMPTETDLGSVNPVPASPASCPPTSCTAGKNVGRDFFVQVVQRLDGVPYSDFAVNALEAWKPYEGTNACWNPLATTKKMEEVCNFNSVGVQNFQNQDMGVRATALTLNLNYYTAIRRMLAKVEFNREAIRSAMGTWGTCSGSTCDPLLNTWQNLYNSSSGDTDDNRTIGSGQTLNGNISPNNDKDTYYFDATANSRVTIRMTRTSGDQLDSFLELYGPNGAMVTVDDDGGGSRNSLINNWQLSAGGRYKIIARSWSYASSGPYSLSLSLSGGGGTSCPDGQFKAEYYNGRSFNTPVFTRCENSVNYDWGGGGPGNGVTNDNFSVRWTGRFNFDGGTKRFIARADDGIKVYLDGSTIIDGWRDQAPTEYRTDRTPTAGVHQVKVEYYENGGGAVAQVRWEAVSSSVSCPNQYKAEYWSNRNMSGNPVLVRCENWPLNHDWGGGSPGGGVPSDGFSARWTGQASINQGTYTFIARADDGIKVYLDGTTIIDAWRDQAPTEYRVNRSVNSGTHTIRIDYYENGGGAVAQFRWEATSNPGSGNLALNRTARATSQESSTYSPSRGNDGNNGSRWSSTISSSLGSQRWYVDLGSTRTINRVRINWETAYAASYRIVWSDNGSNWYYYTNNQYTRGGSGWADHAVGTWAHRYIGVTMLTRAPRMNNYSFFEFEVFGPTLATNSEATEGAPVEIMAPEMIEEDIFLPPRE